METSSLPKIPDDYVWRYSDQHCKWYLFYERYIYPIFSLTDEQIEDHPEVLQELVDEAIIDWQGG